MSENEQAAGDVVAWIEARLAEIEAAAEGGERFSDAKTGQPLRWRQGGPSRGSYVFSESGTLVVGAETTEAAIHVALNDPAAMLTMVSGLRAVVALHPKTTPATRCDGETWAPDHYGAAVDPYWIRCGLSGRHDEHGDPGNTGCHWPLTDFDRAEQDRLPWSCDLDYEPWPCPTLTQIAAALGYTATPEPTHQPPPEQAANESEMRG